MSDEKTRVISPDGSSLDEGPAFATHRLEDLIGRKPKGIYVYRGVVLTSGKPEPELLLMIDEMRPAYRGRLVVLHKEGDMLSLGWRGFVPEDLGINAEIGVPKGAEDGNTWTIERSTQVN